MSYSIRENIINVFFLVAIFLLPVAYCMHNNVAPEVGRIVIITSFLLGAFAIADWYHFYYSNTLKGLLTTIGLGLSAAFVIAAIVSATSESSVGDIFRFTDVTAWEDKEWLLRIFIGSLGLTGVAILGIPRLAIVKGFGGPALPTNDA